MATITRTWTFDGNPSGSQGWYSVPAAPSVGSQVTMGWVSNDGSPASGCLETHLPAGTKSSATSGSYWEVVGTWESLFSIPPGSTITQITSPQHNWDIFTDVVTGGNCTTGPFTLRDNTGAYLGTISSGSGAGSTHAVWATNTGVTFAIPAAQQGSSSNIRLRLENSVLVGNSTSAVITLHQDQIVISVTYTPAIPNPTMVFTGAGSANISTIAGSINVSIQ